jgi:hypothetical protein
MGRFEFHYLQKGLARHLDHNHQIMHSSSIGSNTIKKCRFGEVISCIIQLQHFYTENDSLIFQVRILSICTLSSPMRFSEPSHFQEAYLGQNIRKSIMINIRYINSHRKPAGMPKYAFQPP